jgi:peroxiredoxin
MSEPTPGLELGDPAPDFRVVDTEGRHHQLGEPPGPAATAIVFTCNHCPYALAWHGRVLDAAREYRDRGVRFLAINSNDASRYPADSYPAMQRRVVEDGGWPLPYLWDETQQVARLFGARVTPDVFVLDDRLRLRYRGAPDADYDDPSQRATWLRAALDDLLAGRQVARAQTQPVGCSVKWRDGA